MLIFQGVIQFRLVQIIPAIVYPDIPFSTEPWWRQAWADCVAKLLSDPQLRRNFGEAKKISKKHVGRIRKLI